MEIDLSVLLVEDSEDDALLLLRELRRGGYTPRYERVETEEAMCAALELGGWDIVISDYVMPRFSGLAALSLLRRSDPDTPFIIASGNIGEDIAVEAMRAGAQDYILKGSYARLVPAVKRELQDAQQRRERRRAEEELARRNELLHLVMDNIPQYIYWKDTSLRYLGCNGDFAKKAGLREGNEIVGLASENLDGARLDTNRFLELERDVVESDSPRMHVTMDLAKGAGAFWADLSVVPMHDAEGRVVGVLGLYEDITKQITAEEELRRRREQEDRIKQEAEEAKRQFYSDAMHAVTEGKLNLVGYDEVSGLFPEEPGWVSLESGKDLSDLRRQVTDACAEAGIRGDAAYGFVVAVGEAAANAVKHAAGGLAVVAREADRVRACIKDSGGGISSLILPRATLQRMFSTTMSMGLGYSLILASVDKVYLATGIGGTWIILEKLAPREAAPVSLETVPDSW